MFSIKAPEKNFNCIYSVIRPLYIGARIFGLFPFSVEINSNGKNKISFKYIDLIVIVTLIIIHSCFTFVNLYYNFMELHSTSQLLILGMKIGLVFGQANAIAFMLADLWNRNHIFDIFNLCQDFDLQMQSFGSTLNYKRDKQYICMYIIAWTVISIVYVSISFWICLSQYNLDQITITFTAFFLSTNVFGIVLSIYSFFLFSVKTRFSLLNKTLSQVPVSVTDEVVIKNSTSSIENVMKLADLHDMLNIILDKVNRCYSIQAMLAFGLSFTYKVFSLFGVYRGWIMCTMDRKQLELAIVLMLWASFYCFFVLTVLWAGHSTRKELCFWLVFSIPRKGKLTGVLVHRAINKCLNTKLVERLLAFSQQILYKTPEANCNLFTFDWTLLYSIVAATTTYLIILIQFDSSGYEPLPYGIKNISLNN